MIDGRGASPSVSFICFCAVLALPLLTCSEARTEERVETYIYKQVGDLKVKADVYTKGASPHRPVLVWIHGGALIVGHRESVDRRLKDAFLETGGAVISIDYRLAPETQLPEIIQDIEDAFHWIREK